MASQALGGGKFPAGRGMARLAGSSRGASLLGPHQREGTICPLPSCCPAIAREPSVAGGWCSETLSCLASRCEVPREKSRYETSLNLTTKRLSY